jgi:protein-S-isoprenylcysteine O-methyltransferase Ste14
MTLIPAFEIGVWNAWILALYVPLHPLMMIAIDKLVGVGDINKKMTESPLTRDEKIIFYSMTTFYVLTFIYSIFLPLKLATLWFYIGLPVYIVGLVMLIAAMTNIATTPHGQPFTGVAYRYSRHPMAFWGSIMHLGISIASASWLFLLLSVITAILAHFSVIAEERGCLEYYGDAYRKYMDKTPRWIGIPKS